MSEKKAKINFNEIVSHYLALITSPQEPIGNLKPFRYEWLAEELSCSMRQIYEKKDNGYKPVSDDYVWKKILAYSHQYLANDDYYLNPIKAKQIAETWIATVPTTALQFFSFQDDPKPAHIRLPWIKGAYLNTETPLFDEMFSRMSNANPLKEWVGSLFFREADRQQYVWLTGQGQDGKGSLIRILHTIFGSLFVSKSVSENEHWSASLVGKRLCAFPDTNKSSFCLTGFFKSLTGDDPIEVNEKYKPVYTTRIFTKFIFVSNTTPDVSSSHSDRRRLILVNVDPLERVPTQNEAANYERLLALEAPAFIDKCIHQFESTRQFVGAYIECDYDEYDAIAESKEERLEVIAENEFTFAEHLKIDPYVMQSVLRDHGITNPYEVKNFKEFLERRYGVTHVRERVGGRKKQRFYVGLGRNPVPGKKLGTMGMMVVKSDPEP